MATPGETISFLAGVQNIDGNRFSSLSDLYYLTGILDMTGTLGALAPDERGLIVERVQSFQNPDGGFGDWYRDRSDSGSTLMALRTLRTLGEEPLNTTAATEYLARLQVSGLLYGNYGFRASVTELQADISSTHDVLATYDLLGTDVPNITDVVAYVKDHQNFDGGFGLQTNRGSGIFWSSTMVSTNDGLGALSTLSETPDFRDEAVSFIKGLQFPSGGFGNGGGSGPRVSYTCQAVLALGSLGEPVPRGQDVVSFIKGLQLANGGFIEDDSDTKEGIHTTFFAVKALTALGAGFDGARASEFARWFLDARLDGGYGDYPGLGSTTMFTFDAVSALNLVGARPSDPTAAVAFLRGLQNPDGGFGELGVSDVETTYRAMLALHQLGQPLADMSAAVSFVKGCQNNDGGFGFSNGYVSRVSYTYRAVRALSILGSGPSNAQGAVDYLQGLQTTSGGFGSSVGDNDPDMGSTYRAVRALATLGAAPLEVGSAVQFILGSQNSDGGFRRSPADTTAPSNASTVTFTYDAVLALAYLAGQPPNASSVVSYLTALDNPDGGYGDGPFQRSTVSSTFATLWTLYYLTPNGLNSPPELTDATHDLVSGGASGQVSFSVTVADPDGQMPEWVHLVLDGERHAIPPDPLVPGRYGIVVELPPGTHSARFEAFDGVATNRTADAGFVVQLDEGAPAVTLLLDPDVGLDDTPFMFRVTYSDPDGTPPAYVMIRIDETAWARMVLDAYGSYTCSTTLSPGVHTAWAKASDGTHVGYSLLLEGPRVYTRNASSPDWPTFLKIRDLVEDAYGVYVDYKDVQRSILDGRLVWSVALPDGEAFASYDGSELVDPEDASAPALPAWAVPGLVVITMGVAVIVVIAAMAVRRRRGRGSAGTEDR